MPHAIVEAQRARDEMRLIVFAVGPRAVASPSVASPSVVSPSVVFPSVVFPSVVFPSVVSPSVVSIDTKHLLQSHDVGVNLFQDTDYTSWVEPPVDPDAFVYVVSDNSEFTDLSHPSYLRGVN